MQLGVNGADEACVSHHSCVGAQGKLVGLRLTASSRRADRAHRAVGQSGVLMDDGPHPRRTICGPWGPPRTSPALFRSLKGGDQKEVHLIFQILLH